MIQRIGVNTITPSYLKNVQQTNIQAQQNVNSTPAVVKSTPAFNYTATSLVNAYQAFHGIIPAKTVSFGHLSRNLDIIKDEVRTCKNEAAEQKGEYVGQRWNLLPLSKMNATFTPGEKQETKVLLDADAKVYADATYEKALDKSSVFTMSTNKQNFKINWSDNTTKDTGLYVMETKGALSSVIDDKGTGNVLITNNGDISRISNDNSIPGISARTVGSTSFEPFIAPAKEVVAISDDVTIGGGTEIVIGMEDGRFVPEIIKSIEDFTKKVNSGEIPLPKFVPNPKAKTTQLAMLAGGFGSRAEYTNAASDGILNSNSNPNGAQATKGTFKTSTGLTPMETTFVTLHKAGLLNCSKGQLEIGKNIKFYLNQSGINKGNGGFTVDLYDKMAREGRDSLVVLPNDSMSRMPIAVEEMAEIMNSGNAAIAMIAKKVPSEQARGTFGIMKLDKNNQILEFAEKPKDIPKGYADEDGMCLTNTFQFSVSKEAFKALDILKDEFKVMDKEKNKESRDWSKFFVPVLMSLTQSETASQARDYMVRNISFDLKDINLDLVDEAMSIIGDQKIYAVPTDESWADVGSMSGLYQTTIDIAKNNFKLEPFERNNVLDSINTQTGLVACTKDAKEAVEAKYNCTGAVMAVPKAEKVPSEIVKQYLDNGLITINPKVAK